MDLPKDLLYTREHEWVRVEDSGAAVGITDYAQNELGDVVFVELPDVDSTWEAGEAVATVESVKAVSEIYTPLSGKIIEVNESLDSVPETLNEDPYVGGWIFKLLPAKRDELEDLLSAAEYRAYLDEE